MGVSLKIIFFLASLASVGHAGVTISSPSNGATITCSASPCPVQAAASASEGCTVTNLQLYDNNTCIVNCGYVTGIHSINQTVSLSADSTGISHYLVFKPWCGGTAEAPAAVTVTAKTSSSSGLIPTPPSNATYLEWIDDLKPTTGSQYFLGGTVTPYFSSQNSAFTWKKICTGACSGCPTGAYTSTCTSATAPAARWYWEALNAGDGSAALFGLESITSSGWPSALWALDLGQHQSLSHFIFDFEINLNASASQIQALEFDLIQGNSNGDKFLWGSQCNYAQGGEFEGWNWSSHWVPTGVYCPQFSTNAWHHIRMYLTKTSSSLTYDAVEFDGVDHAVNLTESPKTNDGTYDVVAQFQLDQKTGSAPGYTMGLDKTRVIAW